MAAMHCNREEVVSIAIPDRRFSDTLAVYLLPRLVLTRTLRLLENRLRTADATWQRFVRLCARVRLAHHGLRAPRREERHRHDKVSGLRANVRRGGFEARPPTPSGWGRFRAPVVLGRRAPHPVLGARAGRVAQAGRGASPEDRRGPNRRRAGLTESMAPLPDSLRCGPSLQKLSDKARLRPL